MKTLFAGMAFIGMAMFLSGCGALLSSFVPQQQTQQPTYPVYVDQQQPIVVPTTTSANPAPIVVTPNY